MSRSHYLGDMNGKKTHHTLSQHFLSFTVTDSGNKDVLYQVNGAKTWKVKNIDDFPGLLKVFRIFFHGGTLSPRTMTNGILGIQTALSDWGGNLLPQQIGSWSPRWFLMVINGYQWHRLAHINHQPVSKNRSRIYTEASKVGFPCSYVFTYPLVI